MTPMLIAMRAGIIWWGRGLSGADQNRLRRDRAGAPRRGALKNFASAWRAGIVWAGIVANAA
jgi:hypothetical protein